MVKSPNKRLYGKDFPDSRVDLRFKSLVTGVEIRVEEVDSETRKIDEVRANIHHWLNDACVL